jgi:hypothetical protein
MEAVKTMLPLEPSLMKVLAAAVAQFHEPTTLSLNSLSNSSGVKSRAG